jgi:hypothetical protein
MCSSDLVAVSFFLCADHPSLHSSSHALSLHPPLSCFSTFLHSLCSIFMAAPNKKRDDPGSWIQALLLGAGAVAAVAIGYMLGKQEVRRLGQQFSDENALSHPHSFSQVFV